MLKWKSAKKDQKDRILVWIWTQTRPCYNLNKNLIEGFPRDKNLIQNYYIPHVLPHWHKLIWPNLFWATYEASVNIAYQHAVRFCKSSHHREYNPTIQMRIYTTVVAQCKLYIVGWGGSRRPSLAHKEFNKSSAGTRSAASDTSHHRLMLYGWMSCQVLFCHISLICPIQLTFREISCECIESSLPGPQHFHTGWWMGNDTAI